MTVTCPCGTQFNARNPRARFCSDRCRKRPQRTGKVVSLPEVTATRQAGAIEAATVSELTAAGRLETMLGQTCVALARRLDTPGIDTGSAVASVTRELRATMVEATKGAGATSAPQALQDELAARRASHGR